MCNNWKRYAILLLVIQGTAFGSLCSHSYSMSIFSGHRLLSSHSLKLFSVKSLTQCVQMCLFHISEYTSVAYDNVIGSCETHGVLPGYEAEEIVFPSTAKLYGVVIYQDCTELKQLWRGRSDMYAIKPCLSCSTYKVYCDMDTKDRGWTVFQRRRDGSVDFYRTWDEYAEGFGDVCNAFWLGNEVMHEMTSSGVYELRIDLVDYDDNLLNATYQSFRIESESAKYRLELGSYIDSLSNIDDAMNYGNSCKFSTKDEDNDNSGLHHCARVHNGAWWFNGCFYVHLNGNPFSHMEPNADVGQGISWYSGGVRIQLRFSEMKIRRIG